MEYFEFKYFYLAFYHWNYLFENCEYKKADEQIVENRIKIDVSEAKKYELTNSSIVVFHLFFST